MTELEYRTTQSEVRRIQTGSLMNKNFMDALKKIYPDAIVSSISIIINGNDSTDILTLFHKNKDDANNGIMIVDTTTPGLFTEIQPILSKIRTDYK